MKTLSVIDMANLEASDKQSIFQKCHIRFGAEKPEAHHADRSILN